MVEHKIVEEYTLYDIGVGKLPEESLPSYLVINKKYGVIEYSNYALLHARRFIEEMENELRAAANGTITG